MPKLGLTMETGTIEKWHKKEGDSVSEGEVLFEVMTDKVSLEVESYNAGTLLKILRKEGDEVPVTEVIAYIGKADEKIPGATGPEPDQPEKVPEKVSAEPAKEQTGSGQAGATSDTIPKKDRRDIKISPLARRLAESKGIDISQVTGTGPGGRIVREDIENYKGNASIVSEQGTSGRIKISPLAKRLASELSVDITSVTGTGPGGRIVKEDIEKAAVEKPAASQATASTEAAIKEPVTISIPKAAAKILSSVPLKGIRKVIADRLTYSKQNIPHIISTVIIDVGSLVDIREKIKERVLNVYKVKLTVTDFIIKAVSMVLSEQKVINASLLDGEHIIYDDVNVGLAVATDAGLIVPTIYGADRLSLFDIARMRAELVEKTKSSKLKMEEISNGTFTISNLGMFGVRNFTAIINPPQGAILMVGEIYKDPCVKDDRITVGTFMQISLAVDHRIIDGADGAKYLARLKELLQSPELLLI